MKRLKRFFKWLAIGVGLLLAIALTVNAIASWRAGVRLEALLQPLQEAGDPLKLADLASAPPPPEKNGATFLRRAARDMEALGREIAPLSKDEYLKDDRLTAKGAELVKSAMSAYPDVLPLLEQAANAPEYDPQHDFEIAQPVNEFLTPFLNHVQSLRSAARLLHYRTDLLRRENDRDGAMRASLVSLRFSQQIAREPLLIGYLVALATRSIALEDLDRSLRDGDVSDALRDQLEAQLERSLDESPFVAALKSERAYGLSSFEELTSGPVAAVLLWKFRQDECDYLELLAGEIALAGEPRYRVASELSALQKPPAGIGMLTAGVAPAVAVARTARDRVETVAQCLRVYSALQVFLARNEGQRPELDKLGLPAELTTDPYDGQPLRLKPVDGDWMVYSVGENLKDDGGKSDGMADVGVGLKVEAASEGADEQSGER